MSEAHRLLNLISIAIMQRDWLKYRLTMVFTIVWVMLATVMIMEEYGFVDVRASVSLQKMKPYLLYVVRVFLISTLPYFEQHWLALDMKIKLSPLFVLN